MILDLINNGGKYSALHDGFSLALDFIANKASSMDCGRYQLDGDNVYATIVDADLKSVEDARLEVHDCYIDVQAVLQGSETYGYKPRENCVKSVGAIDKEKDILFFEDSFESSFTVSSGCMMIFYPNDAHAPLIGQGKVRKVIVKVKA